MLHELVFAAVSALLTYGFSWLKQQKIMKDSRWEKVRGIAAAVAPEVAKQGMALLQSAAEKTDWKWDDALVSEVNRRLVGQARPNEVTPEERQKLRDMFPLPPPVSAEPPPPPLPADVVGKLRAGG